ncbi:MAG: hypothetical protein IJS09_00640 [Treponema sp.]|nr:hypothetical protein [Treponema sp.]
MAMIEGALFFHYRTGNTFLHKTPSWLKVLLIPILAILSFQLPTNIALIVWLAVLILAKFLRFTFREIINDLKPTFFYFILLYNTSLVYNISAWNEAANGQVITWEEFVQLFYFAPNYALLFVHMGLSLSITSLFYRTTSNIQFRQGFATIESCITRKETTQFADTLGMTLTFIPRIVTYWQRIDTAWRARNGKNSLRKLTTLTPRLFSVSLNDAYEKARAIENRKV